MNTETQEAPAGTAAPATEVAVETASKDAIYVMIADHVKATTDKRIGKSGGRKIFDMVVEQIFAAATKNGTFRFNGGFGSMHVRNYGAGSRRLPSGQVTTFGERSKLRYEEGVVVQALVENGGILEEALKVRGSRAEAPAEAAAPAAGGQPTGDTDLD